MPGYNPGESSMSVEGNDMETEPNRFVESWLRHIRVLSEEIGPRGSTTEGERKGSEYCAQVMRQLGIEAAVEPFTSARSIYRPHLLASLMMLAAFVLYPIAGRATAIPAAFLALLALVSDLMELGFRDNILRRLMPKGPSQNAVGMVAPSGEHRQDLVLIGHVDSHRTPLIFRTPRWVAIYKAFTTTAFVTFTAQTLLYFLGIFTGWIWIWPVTAVSAVSAVLLMALCLQADSTPFSAGANDNASGAGLVLALAEHLRVEPLGHTRVWLACTGCEEVQHYGAIDFFRRHLGEMSRPSALVFEMLGCAGPAWLLSEGIIVPFHADPGLVALAEGLAGEHPDWGAYGTQISGGNTETADALRAGVPSITLIGLTPDGGAPYWHMVEDTADRMNPEVMRRAYAFTWAFMRALDSRA